MSSPTVAATFAAALRRAAGRRVVGPRAGQPHRRAHRLQRRASCLPIALPHAHLGRGPARATDRTVRVGRRSPGELVTVDLDEVAPGPPPAGRPTSPASSGRCGRPATGVPGPTSPSTAGCRSAPGCRSSAALECAVAVALSDLCGLGPGADDAVADPLAASAPAPRTTIARAPTGGMDQSASLRCTRRPRHSSGLPRRLDRAGAVRPRRARPRPARHGHPRRARAGRRPVRRAAAHLRAGRRRARRHQPARGALRRLDAALARLADRVVRRRVRHIVTEIERVRATVALLREDRSTEVGAAVRRVARVDARRLRDLAAPSSTSRSRPPRRTARSGPG